MAGLSDYQLQTMLNLHFGAAGSPFTAPSAYHFALMTTAPNDNGFGVEVSGGSYARVSVTNNSTNFPPSTLGTPSILNGAAISWGTAGAAWGSIVGVAIYNHATNSGSSNFIGYIAKAFTVASGDTVTLPVGALTISFA